MSLIIRAAEAGNGLYEYAVNSEKIDEKLDYLIRDSITEFLDNFSITLNEDIVDTMVPNIESIKSIRKNEAFSMFIFFNS